MSGSLNKAFVFVQNAFYKFCFCLGLSTASYYSFAQVQSWVGSPVDSAPLVSTSGLQVKVDSLMDRLSGEPLHVFAAGNEGPKVDLEHPLTFRENPKIYAQVAAGVVPAIVDASPAPSVSPTPAEATAEAGKEGEVKEGEVAKTEGEVIPVQVPFPMMPTQGQFDQYAQVAPLDPATPQNSTDNGTNGNPPTLPSGGVPTAGSNANSNLDQSSTGSGPAPSSNPSTLLTSSDLALFGAPIKASFVDKSETVTGLLCALGAADGTVTGCSKTSSYSIHTSRWSDTEGLSNDAGFVIRSSSESGQLQVDLSVKIQNLQQAFQTLTSTVSPTQIQARTEIRNGKHYRIFEISLPNVTLRANDVLSHVVATLSYDVTSTTGVLSPDSTVAFVRSHTQTTNSVWDQSGTNRAPATSDQVVVADQISYSMSLIKSP